PFSTFLAPGLVMMAITQNAFANTSSSIVISKVQGNIVDVLMPPLSAWELTVGYGLSGATRGLIVGAACVVAVALVTPLPFASVPLILLFGMLAALALSLIGVVGGIWSEKFDHIAAVTNFIVTPLAFLSGTFYSIDRLPEDWRFIAFLNPVFYMIDGFRAGFIGQAEASPWVGAAVLIALNAGLFALAWWMFARGYKLKT
ncbi:MAG: ABC transporter permease, partial [Pseudomonadota bacterium]